MFWKQIQQFQKGIKANEVFTDGLPTGWKAICPCCQAENFCSYDETGKLLWYNDGKINTFCSHNTGLYNPFVFVFQW